MDPSVIPRFPSHAADPSLPLPTARLQLNFTCAGALSMVLHPPITLPSSSGSKQTAAAQDRWFSLAYAQICGYHLGDVLIPERLATWQANTWCRRPRVCVRAYV